MDVMARATNRAIADGEVAWSRHPDAGVQLRVIKARGGGG
jgi:hypothetical protein